MTAQETSARGHQTLSEEAVTAALRQFVAQWFRGGRQEGLEAETPLVTSGIIDSAGVIEVVEFLEGRYGVRIGDEDISLANCDTMRGWARMVLERGGRAD
jgi:acyl carrier protein